jgi:hypothetical protein
LCEVHGESLGWVLGAADHTAAATVKQVEQQQLYMSLENRCKKVRMYFLERNDYERI